MKPEHAMKLALAEARRGQGRTFPNPSVGAVVVRGDRVLGRGYSRPAGGPHAEVVAIDQARRREGEAALRRATLVVTLEPCSHHGRTGPCTDRIEAAGIPRVWVGLRDPHSLVSGRGLRRLRRLGVSLRTGVLEDECREHHRSFLSVCERGRPWVVLKLASSLDGRIATASGESRWITGPRARAFVHDLRAASDAVMVGSGTARADDPALTARRGERIRHAPVRVLVDSKLSVPTSARLYQEPRGEAWVLCGSGARGRAARAAVGARVLEVRRRGRSLDLPAALGRLASEGLTQVLVEGGGRLAASLLHSRCVDEIHWFIAPRLIGADGRAALGPLRLRRLAEAEQFEAVEIRRLGDDVHLAARISQARQSDRRRPGA